MCRPENAASRIGLGNQQKDNNACLWPVVSPLFLIGIAILLPVALPLLKSMLFNAGYTKWFHWLSLVHLLTQNTFLSRLLAVMGMTVTLGWWASMLYDLVMYGRLAHILHLNMPFTDRMVILAATNNVQIVVYNEQTLPYILFSHLLDTLGHPVLALYYWKVNNCDICRICTWPVLVSAYMLSRTWSLVRLSLIFLLIFFCHS